MGHRAKPVSHGTLLLQLCLGYWAQLPFKVLLAAHGSPSLPKETQTEFLGPVLSGLALAVASIWGVKQ